MPYINRDAKNDIARLVGDLANIAAAKDIDSASYIVRDIAGILGMDASDFPGYDAMLDDIHEMNTHARRTF